MKRIKNRSIFVLLTIILSLGITLGAVYYMYQYKDSRENKLATSMISINFTEKSNVINLTSNVPMIDDLGLKGTPYEFSITNTSTVPIKANIKLDVDNDTTIKYGAVRYALFIDDERVIKDYLHKDNLTLYEVSELKPNEVINCKLYFWIDYYYDYPGEIFKAKIKAVGENIDELQQEAITVTFDADGGVLNTITKEVYYHGYYGELPEPTKEGYTFMGWNGKNMFNRNDVLNGYIDDNTGLLVLASKSNSSNYIEIDCNKKYIIRPILSSGNWGAFYDNNKNFVSGFVYWNGNPITCNQNQKYIRFTISYVNSNSQWYNTTQIEEGEQATEYEPYYITSNTKVVQNHNHTLKAIWKKNG